MDMEFKKQALELNEEGTGKTIVKIDGNEAATK